MKKLALFVALNLLLLPAAARSETGSAGLSARIHALVAQAGSTMKPAVTVIDLPSGARLDIRGEEPFPLASVFKLPIMIELARQIQAGEPGITLQTELRLRESDKCIGGGDIKYRSDGSKVTVEEAVTLMETISDNTATDLIFNLIGLDSVNRMMADLGFKHTDIYLTNRPAYLVSLGMGREFKGLGARQIARHWLALSSDQRKAARERILKENEHLTLAQFQAVEDASAARQTGSAYDDDVVVAAATDNLASSGDLAVLLQKLYQGELLNPQWTRTCLDILAAQKFNSRIPRYLPAGTTVYHKTGTITGIANDAGIIRLGADRAAVVVVLVRDIREGHSAQASTLIARIARAVYDAYH